PDNLSLRVHLAGVLLDAGRPDEAALHSGHVLGVDPAHPDALVLAERSARMVGDLSLADELHARRREIAGDDEEPAPEHQRPRRFRRRPSRF
ncbi:MAG: hypothetical protein ACLGHT_02495, partial [Acidimicrobiia bacterium]